MNLFCSVAALTALLARATFFLSNTIAKLILTRNENEVSSRVAAKSVARRTSQVTGHLDRHGDHGTEHRHFLGH